MCPQFCLIHACFISIFMLFHIYFTLTLWESLFVGGNSHFLEGFKYIPLKCILIRYGGTCLSMTTARARLKQEDCREHRASEQYIWIPGQHELYIAWDITSKEPIYTFMFLMTALLFFKSHPQNNCHVCVQYTFYTHVDCIAYENEGFVKSISERL